MEWTEEEIAHLKEIAKDHTYKELSQLFGRSIDAIRAKCRELAICKGNPSHRTKNHCRDIFQYFKEFGLAETLKKFDLSKNVALGIVFREKQREKKLSQGVDPLKAEKFRMRALKYALKTHLEAHSEDFASYCVLRLYENKISPLNYMLVDFKRETFGSTRSKIGKLESNANNFYVPIDSPDPETIKHEPVDQSDKVRMFELVHSIHVKGSERTCLILHAVFGLHVWEIALVLDVPEHTVRQLLTIAQAQMQKK